MRGQGMARLMFAGLALALATAHPRSAAAEPPGDSYEPSVAKKVTTLTLVGIATVSMAIAVGYKVDASIKSGERHDLGASETACATQSSACDRYQELLATERSDQRTAIAFMVPASLAVLGLAGVVFLWPDKQTAISIAPSYTPTATSVQLRTSF